MSLAPSVDDLVDLAEKNHLSPKIEGDFVDATYAAAFALVGKHRGDLDDFARVERLRRASHGSIRVALLARKRARATWDLNASDADAAEAFRLLTDLAASFIPAGRPSARNYSS